MVLKRKDSGLGLRNGECEKFSYSGCILKVDAGICCWIGCT